MSAPKSPKDHVLNPNFDYWVNPWIPHNRLTRLPKPITHFLGVRQQPHVEPPAIVQWALMVLSTVAGLCLVGAVFNLASGLDYLHPPVMIASLGASAVLDYNAIRSPLAQPRNAVIGHTLSAIVEVAISKLFQLAPEPFFDNYSWVAGAVACACASLVMSMTGTVHPPGGATAILACTSKDVVPSGWAFAMFVLVGSLLMLGVALLFNNTLRQYPVYWWTPEEVGRQLRRSRKGESTEAVEDENRIEKQSSRDSDATLRQELSNQIDFVDDSEELLMTPYKLRIPSHIELADDEVSLLNKLQQRLQARNEVGT
ncbi:HPP family protein [Hortaea werneckii]|nr:HPP family protein [Hortaea werneckii]